MLCVVCVCVVCVCVVFFQAEDGIRDLVRSRGLGDVYKRQRPDGEVLVAGEGRGLPDGVQARERIRRAAGGVSVGHERAWLLYTSDAAEGRCRVDLGGRRIIKKKKTRYQHARTHKIIETADRTHTQNRHKGTKK